MMPPAGPITPEPEGTDMTTKAHKTNRRNVPVTHPDIATAIGGALGCNARVTEAREWNSITFAGERLVVEIDGEPPAGLDCINFGDIPGTIIADISQIDARRLDVLTIKNG
jgi:hypothetical protein